MLLVSFYVIWICFFDIFLKTFSFFFWIYFFNLFLIYFLNFFNIFWYIFFIFLFLICLCRFHLPMICPWSACNLQGPPAKSAKNFVLVNFFRFSKNREKSQKTQRKSGFLCHFLLIKTAFFLKRSSQKCIIKTIISYTTNAQLFHWKTVRKCLHTNVIHLFFNFWNCFCNILF